MKERLKKLRRLRIPHFGLKLVSLLLAFLAWQGVREATSYETRVSDVPIRIEVPPGWSVLRRSSETADIRFRGSRSDIRELSGGFVEVRFRLQKVPEDLSAELEITPDQIVTTSDARPVQVRPGRVSVEFDHEITRQLPIKPRLKGDLPEGLSVEQTVCRPASATVRGPRSRLDQVEYLRTEPIELGGHVSSFATDVPVVLPGRLWDAELEPARARVQITIANRIMTRTFERIPIYILHGGDGRFTFSVHPSTARLSVRGSGGRIESLNSERMRLYVDCSGIDEAATYELPIETDLPAGIEKVETVPDAVRVICETGKTKP
ncbi:YbbR-like domain-containing protein [Kiritimatiella glycovorans]|uniref:YbbR-like protein n=1 Tax=Kiritimatiella glycovorans TaxID=1307763 RepID=A0A0G3EIX2_9BACT|nr:YbbR-like domain-containing protein [Kiritimatiella glycovorans]AKJ65357.1 YbbR-like protein [Kiritimatiella glycovorans]